MSLVSSWSVGPHRDGLLASTKIVNCQGAVISGLIMGLVAAINLRYDRRLQKRYVPAFTEEDREAKAATRSRAVVFFPVTSLIVLAPRPT